MQRRKEVKKRDMKNGILICKYCGKEFSNISGISAHLTNSRHNNECKCDLKEYYDKFFKDEDEGKCLNPDCKNIANFNGLNIGYGERRYCKKCRVQSEEFKENRLKKLNEKIEKKRKELEEIEKNRNYCLPYRCRECENKLVLFENIIGLSKHISTYHKDITIKQYYNKYYKKEGEGICPVTGANTTFSSMTKGYLKYSLDGQHKSEKVKEKKKKTYMDKYGYENPAFINSEKRIEKYKKTRKDQRDLLEKRKQLIEILRKQSIDKNNKLQCQVCGRIFDNIGSLSLHIKYHNMTSKQYYDTYLKKDGEGICPISGLETTFNGMNHGYYKYHKDHTINLRVEGSKEGTRKKLIKSILKNQNKFDIEIQNVENIIKVTDMVDIKCLKCNNIYQNRWYNIQLGYGKCPSCYKPITSHSEVEKELLDYIKEILENKYTIYENYKDLIINPKTGRKWELDIFIPELNVAFEFNGLYWHSDSIVDKNYHLFKTKGCINQNIRLIQIFEDEWYFKKELVKNKIKHILGINNNPKIYARKCEIKEIDSNIKNEFLEQYHIQGKDSSNIKLGAFYNNELVAVMTFSYGNISKGGNPDNKTSWELNRFCTHSNYIVVGIAGKLLEYFKKNYEWKEIYSYADLRWSDGWLYHKLNFKLEHLVKPDYYYIKGNKRIHRYNLRKRKDEPKDVTELILRENEGYKRIYDSGKLKFKLINE